MEVQMKVPYPKEEGKVDSKKLKAKEKYKTFFNTLNPLFLLIFKCFLKLFQKGNKDLK